MTSTGDEKPDLIAARVDITRQLAGTLAPDGIEKWFDARLRLLGGRTPNEALAVGDEEAVRLAAASFVEGAYI